MDIEVDTTKERDRKGIFRPREENYGAFCSSVVVVYADGRVKFTERTYQDTEEAEVNLEMVNKINEAVGTNMTEMDYSRNGWTEQSFEDKFYQ